MIQFYSKPRHGCRSPHEHSCFKHVALKRPYSASELCVPSKCHSLSREFLGAAFILPLIPSAGAGDPLGYLHNNPSPALPSRTTTTNIRKALRGPTSMASVHVTHSVPRPREVACLPPSWSIYGSSVMPPSTRKEAETGHLCWTLMLRGIEELSSDSYQSTQHILSY